MVCFEGDEKIGVGGRDVVLNRIDVTSQQFAPD